MTRGISKALAILSDLRWSLAVTLGLSGLGGASLLARRWWEQTRQSELPTQVSYLIEWLGLREPIHSGWFICGLGLLGLNLLARLLSFVVEGIDERRNAPPSLNVFRKGGKTGPDSKLEVPYVEHETHLSREEFREWVRALRPEASFVRDEGGVTELQAFWREGAPTWVLGILFHLGCLFVLGGAVDRLYYAPSARIQTELGRPTDFVELTRGHAPSSWQFWSESRSREFYRPGWTVMLSEVDAESDRPSARLQIGETVLDVVSGAPSRLGGFSWYLETLGKGSGETVSLLAVDREQKTEIRLHGLAPGAVVRRPEFELRVLRVIRDEERAPGEDSAGPWAELEYLPASGESAETAAALPEVFPVFLNHPTYDSVKRATSRWNFIWDGSAPSQIAEVLIVGKEGRGWVWFGFLLMIGAAVLGIALPPTQNWCAWKQKHVIFLCSSYFLSAFRLLVKRRQERFGLWMKKRDPNSQRLTKQERAT